MSGLFRRIRRTRAAAAAEDSRPEAPAPSEPRDAPTTADSTGAQQPLAAMRDLPAGLEPDDLRRPGATTERRSRLRRRTRYLRRVRELLLRDLGGLVYEIHRAGGGDRVHQQALVRGKTERIAALDGELFALENRLGSAHPETVLREPGVGGTCPTCGELYSSHAKFCSACGRPLTGRAAAREAAAEQHPPAPEAARETAATRVEGDRAPSDAARRQREAMLGALPVERGAAAAGGEEATRVDREAAATGGEEATRVDREAATSGDEEAQAERAAAATGGEEATRVDRGTAGDEPTRVDNPAKGDEPPPSDAHDARYTSNGRSGSSDLATPAERPS
jgi:hypothetical protein